jgi:hypothetical protein
MKTNKLTTTINNRLIYKQKNLSFHTKAILSKMVTDIICGHEEPNFFYMEENIFTVWPEDIVWNAIEELAECEIMFIDFKDEDEPDEDDEECEIEELIFNPEFIEKVFPSIKHCPCCDPAPTNFNVNYN